MKRFRWPWMSTPDDEYLANVRQSIRSWDRWKFWFVLFHVVLLITATWIFSNVIPLLAAVVQPNGVPFAVLGFVTGTVLEIVFGWIIYGILHGLMTVLTGMRAERMLVKLLDAVKLEDHVDAPNQTTRIQSIKCETLVLDSRP